MANQTAMLSHDIHQLSTLLLATLDEGVFFSELCRHLQNELKSERALVYLVKEDGCAQLISIDGKLHSERSVLEKGEGAAGHVLRTKRPYFSNNVSRDPIFAKEALEGVRAELCLPISHEGVVIATIHFQDIKSEREFSREDINLVLAVLNELKHPLANMRMYIAAKHLNESLMRQIEVKEKELQEKKTGLKIADTFKIEERPVIGRSETMKELLAVADRAGSSDKGVFILGEAGTGKEMIARRIHCRSPRASRAFISIDCLAHTEAQLEAEIFGQESREVNSRPGALELANGGTIFIANIHALSLHLQAKLNLFVHEKLAFRMGGQIPYKSDVRIIVATVRDLPALVADGLFREDLFYGLNTIALKVPALRERQDDIESLATHFLNHGRGRDEQKSFSPGAIKALVEYRWNGNVRELQNVVERSYILSEGMIVERDHLAEQVTAAVEVVCEETSEELYSFSEMTLDELERKHICMTLDHLGGNKTKTAKMLGITVKTLYNKLHSYGLIAAAVKELQ
jgi:Nif-specific regulatory protein